MNDELECKDCLDTLFINMIIFCANGDGPFCENCYFEHETNFERG